MRYPFLLASLALSLAFQVCYAQNRFEVIDSDIKSVQCYTNTDIAAFPSILLGSPDVISIEFDDLNEKAPRNLSYTITHCDEFWRDEGMFPTDFLEGFQEQPLYNSGFSNNTAVRYTHYTITFPNSSVKPKVSGNYLLTVMDADRQEPLLRVGFQIVENAASQVSSIIIPNNSSYLTSQQLNLTLLYPLINVTSPGNEIKSKVYQNYVLLPENMQPKAISYGMNQAVYSRPDLNIYPAGNEYRRLDIRDPHYISTNANVIRQSGTGMYYIFLVPDVSRADMPYTYNDDLDGKMIISGLSQNINPATDCDYYSVLFSYKSPYLGDRFDMYIDGELTGWMPTNYNKMLYNHQTGCYELTLLLKQGYYGYKYSVRDQYGVEQQDLSPEGNFSQTQNTYQVSAYYKGIRDIYTRLISSTTLGKKPKILK